MKTNNTIIKKIKSFFRFSLFEDLKPIPIDWEAWEKQYLAKEKYIKDLEVMLESLKEHNKKMTEGKK